MRVAVDDRVDQALENVQGVIPERPLESEFDQSRFRQRAFQGQMGDDRRLVGEGASHFPQALGRIAEFVDGDDHHVGSQAISPYLERSGAFDLGRSSGQGFGKASGREQAQDVQAETSREGDVVRVIDRDDEERSMRRRRRGNVGISVVHGTSGNGWSVECASKTEQDERRFVNWQ